jgi:hypothetical protein
VSDGAEQRASELLVWCDALTEAGLAEVARRSRVVARDALELVAELAAERSAREALQERCELQQAILGRHAEQALIETNSHTHTRLSQRGVGR